MSFFPATTILFLVLFGSLQNVAEGWCVHGEIKPLSEVSPHSQADDTCNTCECYIDAWDCTYSECATGPKFKEIGELGNSTFFWSNEKHQWSNARTKCQEQLGGDLAVTSSMAAWDQFKAKLEESNDFQDDFFVGAKSELGYQGPWKWLDGTSFSKRDRRWSFGQPNDNSVACLSINGWSEFKSWTDMDCSFSQHFVCQVPKKEVAAEKRK